ncbi:MAG: anthranilate synthase component I family protein, partial [bacterium]|nr:anthranilate synthase component I family protein [bacterium]
MQIPKIHIAQKPNYVKLADGTDFFDLFKKIERRFDTCFIFESLGEEGKFARYSILGFEPAHLVSGRGKELTIDGKNYSVPNPYYALRDIMPQRTIGRNYDGGLVGYLSYEAINLMEPALNVKVHNAFDQFLFGVYTDGLILDKLTGELTYFYYDGDRPACAMHADRSAMLKEIIASEIEAEPFSAECLDEGLSEKEHAKIVEDVKEKIREGKTFQCEVGFKTKYKITGDTLHIYERLREINPSPFMYYLKFHSKKIIGASPELLFSLRDGEMTTRPLAGTIRRGATPQEDQQLARELVNDEKERAEHNMLVDLHRNDIGKVAKFGTVKIRDLMAVKKFSHVQHISSEVVGTIRPEEDMFSGFASQFPMGTVCGTPKIETIKIIDANEKEARGPYGGGVGHFGFNGDCTFALALR